MNTPVKTSSEQVLRSANGQVQKGSCLNPAGRPKGSVGGRMRALHLLDEIVAEDTCQDALRTAMRDELLADPAKFFLRFIVPLIPRESLHRIQAEVATVKWTSILDSFPDDQK